VDHANRVFRHHYTSQEISVDESLVGTKNKTNLMQYLPKKHHHRWGTEFWMLCDSMSNYCLGVFIHRRARCQEDKGNIKKGLRHTSMRKLLAIGEYPKKATMAWSRNISCLSHMFCHLHQLSAYIKQKNKTNSMVLVRK
jgi:hypothetical protein